MKPIVDDIETIRFKVKKKMRYCTVGDYLNNNQIELFAGMTKLERLCVGLHEMIEMLILHAQGVTSEQVTEWDTKDSHGAYDPTMYDKDERYKEAHEFAEVIEKMLVELHGVSYKDYSKHIDSLKVPYPRK